MEISINDLSFKGQFKSLDEAKYCVKKIAFASLASKKLTGNEPVRRTRLLASRPFIGDKTIDQFKIELLKSKKPEDQTLLTVLLTNVVQGPFIDNSELNADVKEIQSVCKEPVDGSSLHYYLSKERESIHALISAENSGAYNSSYFEIEVPGLRVVKVINIITDACCENYTRRYESSPKHKIKKDKVIAGKLHSKMDLSDSVAQDCLNNGFQVLHSKYVYFFTNEQWYEFPQHVDGRYHGYPIGTPGNNVFINRIKRVFGEPPYKDTGYKFCAL
ncbi:hypothetical protein [Halomonas sp. HL-93]|uniref:hypothetical protein n=1 Tax=Halomonas sp. HL-93 TaxID=1666906 RepID=UPI0006DB9084|nr:hypothetical protein [Halomonas sp. HL-93]KPQ21263.1 MAG: hypothetical protein HLUCCO06_12155 [Halomonas sp. HL-93]SBR50887.1 hypothetical protein GA0071314_2916 [Halomonas sp. HL-93]